MPPALNAATRPLRLARLPPATAEWHGSGHARCTPWKTSLRSCLLDHLIRAEQKRSRDGHSKRLGRPGIDDHVELDRLLHGQVAGRGAPEDPVDVDAGHVIHLR